MIRSRQTRSVLLCASILLALFFSGATRADETAPVRDPKQPVNEAYTAKIKKYTTAPVFTSPLVDYLPASKNVPTPDTILGDISGAPGILPSAADVYKSMRLLAKATPRVKVFSIATPQAARELMPHAASSPQLLKPHVQN